MRTTTRAVAIITALVLALTAVITVVGAVDAMAADRRPRHNLRVDAKEIDGANRFVLFGKVPTFPRGRIVLKRSVAGADYTKLKSIRTRSTGRFRARIYQVPGRLTCFKVVVPKTSDHRRTTSRGAACIES